MRDHAVGIRVKPHAGRHKVILRATVVDFCTSLQQQPPIRDAERTSDGSELGGLCDARTKAYEEDCDDERPVSIHEA